MVDPQLQNSLMQMMAGWEDAGVFIAMFLESSVVPIPSEVVIIGAGALGLPLASIMIFGSLGSTMGACVGYALGRYAAMPVILKFGKFILIKPHHIEKAEAFAKKYGAWSVLIGRLVPIVPFKVFSIASGIVKMPFVPFVICTLAGVLPRIFLLAIFGEAIAKYTKPTVIITLLLLFLFSAFKITSYIQNKGRVSK